MVTSGRQPHRPGHGRRGAAAPRHGSECSWSGCGVALSGPRPTKSREGKYSAGTLSHEQLMTSIELYGPRVAPMARSELSRRPADQPTEPAGGS